MSVNMSKGQRISLEKQGGGELTKVRMGLGWDAIPKKGLFGRKKTKDVDLDASCVILDEARNEVDAGLVQEAQVLRRLDRAHR